MPAARSPRLPGLSLFLVAFVVACHANPARPEGPERISRDGAVPPTGGAVSGVAEAAPMPVADTIRAPRRYHGVPLSRAIEQIRREAGVNIDLHAPSDPAVTFSAHDSLSWEELLRGVVESTDFTLHRRSSSTRTSAPSSSPSRSSGRRAS